jgi:hypothetical protein
MAVLDIKYDLNLETTEIDGKRHYITPEGNVYPSMTTILSRNEKGDQLKKWIEKVGVAEAERIRNNSAALGTAMHELAEAHIRGLPQPKASWQAVDRWHDIKPIVDNDVGRVFGIETALYTDTLKIAGRTDLVGEYKGIPAVIDFKNARRKRKREMITNYFLQCAGYAYMWYERTKDPETCPRQIVIIMTVENEGAEVFVENVKPWVEPLKEVIERCYYE